MRPEDLEDVVVGLEDDLPLDVEDQFEVEGALRVGRPLRVGGVLMDMSFQSHIISVHWIKK